MRVKLFPLSVILLSLGAVTPAFAQPKITLTPYVSGFSAPVEATHAGDERLFVVERAGTIWIIDSLGQKSSTPFLDLTSIVNSAEGEQGLLGLAFPADYDSSGKFYVFYTKGNGAMTLARYAVSATDRNIAEPTSGENLESFSQPFGNHNGGCLRFGPDGYLYFSLGDGGSGGDPGNRAQTLTNGLGKIHRIDVSSPTGYSIPADNPFVGVFGNVESIWAYGLRNPWKFSFDPDNGDLWIADVGQDAREEVNRIAGDSAGVNYGWKCREGTAVFSSNNCNVIGELPVWDYAHGSTTGESVTGGLVYRGENFSSLQGHYVFGDYVSGYFWTLFPNDQGGYDTTNQGKLLPKGQLTSFGEDSAGEIYALSKSGTVYQIETNTTSIPAPQLEQIRLQYLESGPVRVSWDEQHVPALVEVFDLSGRLVRYEETNENYFIMEPSMLPGLYFVKVHAGREYAGKVLMR